MNQNTTSSRLLTKVIVILLISLAVGGIWFVKSNNKGGLRETSSSSGQNPDFALHVTEALDIEKLKSYGLPIIIDFGADSCIPCKEMAPGLKELNENLQGKAIVRFVDVWKYRNLAEGYPLRVIPTQFFFDKEGKAFTPSNSTGIPLQTYSNKETNAHIFTLHEGGLTKEQLLDLLREMRME